MKERPELSHPSQKFSCVVEGNPFLVQPRGLSAINVVGKLREVTPKACLQMAKPQWIFQAGWMIFPHVSTCKPAELICSRKWDQWNTERKGRERILRAQLEESNSVSRCALSTQSEFKKGFFFCLLVWFVFCVCVCWPLHLEKNNQPLHPYEPQRQFIVEYPVVTLTMFF